MLVVIKPVVLSPVAIFTLYSYCGYMDTKKFVQAMTHRIKAQREASGYSQEGFASFINLDRSNYGAIERGERNITVFVLARIAVGLNIKIDKLVPTLEELKHIIEE